MPWLLNWFVTLTYFTRLASAESAMVPLRRSAAEFKVRTVVFCCSVIKAFAVNSRGYPVSTILARGAFCLITATMALILPGSWGSLTASEFTRAALQVAVAVEAAHCAAAAPASMSFPPTVTVMTEAFARYAAVPEL